MYVIILSILHIVDMTINMVFLFKFSTKVQCENCIIESWMKKFEKIWGKWHARLNKLVCCLIGWCKVCWLIGWCWVCWYRVSWLVIWNRCAVRFLVTLAVSFDFFDFSVETTVVIGGVPIPQRGWNRRLPKSCKFP